jgi:hypothetical protein
MTRREAFRSLAIVPALALRGQDSKIQSPVVTRPESFKVYTEGPRLLLRPARLRLLKRERERRSLRWDQFETLWTAGEQFPELGWAEALRFQIADDKQAGTRAIAWALGPADPAREGDVRQMALIADWCESLLAGDDKSQLMTKLERAATDSRAPKNLAEVRSTVFAAIALSEAKPAVSEKALQTAFDGFWNGFTATLKNAKASVPNADAYALLEIMHALRDNLNFDARESFPAWFRQYPVQHLLAHYPAPWPAAENEFHIPADTAIEKTGPDLRKAALSRAAELAMVAYDANIASSQLLQGWLTNDRFLMRGAYGMPYEFLWANPYQPGLSYYHAPLAFHDEIGGQLFVRSSWEDDAAWVGFFGGQLQLFKDGSVTQMNPALAHDPLDIETATIFFARAGKRFEVAKKDPEAAVFVVGLDPKSVWHFEVDGEEMSEERADPGGIIFLPQVPGGGVRFGPAPVT